MKALLTTTIIWLTVLTASAQYTFVKQWDYRFGGTLRDPLDCLIETKDGGFMLGGFSPSGISGDKTQANWDVSLNTADYWIVKIDSSGLKQWDKRYGGFGQDNLSCMQQTFDGGYILAGVSPSGIGGDKTEPGWGNTDYWIVKIDEAGNKQWDKRYGGVFADELVSIIQARDSGYLIGGYSNSPISGDKTEASRGGYDYWLVKTDASGNKEWDKRFGGTAYDTYGLVEQTSDGGYMCAGTSASDSSGDKTQASWGGTYDYWVVKIDSAGNKIWDRCFGSPDGDYCFTFLKTQDEGFLLGGTGGHSGGDKTQDTKGSADYWIVKIDSSGSKQWDRDFGADGSDQLFSLSKTNDGGYVLSGTSESVMAGGDKTENNLGAGQSWIIKTDSLGHKQWDKTIFTIGNDLWSGLCLQTKDGCYVVANNTTAGIGGYKTQDTRGLEDYWILKFCMEPYNAIEEPQTPKGDLMQVWPNPFSNDVSIALTNQQIQQATFTITDATGRVVYQKEENNLAPGYTKVLDLSPLANGVYFVTVSTPTSPKGHLSSQVKRVVKQ